MPIMSPDDLCTLLATLHESDDETRDELLTDLLLVAYPTRQTQNG